MKKCRYLLAVLVVVVVTLSVVACNVTSGITIKPNGDLSVNLTVGDTDVDFTKYFSITDAEGNAVTVTADMLDLSEVDLTKEGTFDVKCVYGGKELVLTFRVVKSENPTPEKKATVTIKTDKSFSLKIGTEIDYADYFVVVDADGNSVTVTSDMLDLSKVDVTKEGSFEVVCSYDGVSATAKFTVTKDGAQTGLTLDEIFAKYANVKTWNFAVSSTVDYSDGTSYEDDFAYCGNVIRYKHKNAEDDTDTYLYVDYISIDDATETYVYYYDLGNETYKSVNYTAAELSEISFPELLMDGLSGKKFTLNGDRYIADDPQSVGDDVYGTLDGCSYTKVELFVENDDISKIVFYSDEVYDGTTYNCVASFVIDDHGNIDYDVKDLEVVYGNVENPSELAEILARYTDETTWNFAIDVEIKINGSPSNSIGVSYSGSDVKYVYMSESTLMTDYLVYDETNDAYAYYQDNGDGTHTKITDDNLFFVYYLSSMYPLYLFDVDKCMFEKVDDHYEAVYAQITGDELYGSGDGIVYTTVELYVEGDKISSIVFFSDEQDEELGAYSAETTFSLSGYGTQSIDISGLTVVDGGSEMPDEPVENPAELSQALSRYVDYDSWNFRVELTGKESGETVYEDTYWYLGRNTKNQYLDTDGNICTDYLVYNQSTDSYVYYLDCLDGTYDKYSQDADEYYELISYMYLVDPNLFLYIEFELTDGKYLAKNPVLAGETFVGSLSDDTYSAFAITLTNEYISSIDIYLTSGYVLTYSFLDYNNVSFEIPGSGSGSENPVTDGSKSTFIGANLAVGEGEMEYTSTVGAVGLDEVRGLQFTQANGKVTLTSKGTFAGVNGVTLEVQTNADNGMIVSVKVGGVSLTSGGLQSVTISKGAYNEVQKVTFVSSVELSGQVEVTLTPTQSKKSMYILSIEVGKTSGGSDTPQPPVDPTDEVMEDQTYDSGTFDDDRLQDVILKKDEAIGLPSVGNINVLVIPVQISGTTITQAQLDKLQKAFNGSSQDTGWESVSSFYSKSSYGKLNLTFDFTDVYKTSNNASYYETHSESIGDGYYETGSELLLREALTYFDSSIDYSKYDTNGDGCIDAVYIIYSAPVDYDNEAFYWAYVTNYYGEEQYDGKYAYYYMFAGFDFMDENASDLGLTINTETYVHESGHLLGLDDYYDYAKDKGANEGLGGADMMDYNIGDHGAYSKIMLGWMDATIVTSTTTITISSLASKGECILIPLAFNNSYFSEYLLIDLYSATGLNEMEANQDAFTNYLYDGASYGVRIYHVSSACDNSYDTEDYYSVTDKNNSYSDIALIKLVEADGEKKFASSSGVASSSDLWHAGDVFSQVLSAYTRNDGKKVNFDIAIVSDSSNEATITITFNTTANA